MPHPEDESIYKDILLQSFQQAIEEGSLELSLKPALERFNAINGVVTVGSCEGHPERNVLHATVDLAVSDVKWNKIQTYIEDLLPSDGGISSVELHYGSLEDEIQRSVRIQTHLMLVKEKAVQPLIDFANRLDALTKVGGWELGDMVVLSAKRHPADWPRRCEKCGSENIKIVYTEFEGVKRHSWVECFACQEEERRSNLCPHCYDRMNFEGTRGGMYMLHELPDVPGTFRCPHCKNAYVKKDNRPVRVTILEP